MSEFICCVCHQPVGPEPKRIGGRCYCERHYAKVSHHRPSIWRAGLGLILGQLAFVLLVELLLLLFKPSLTGAALVAVGIILAVIPAAIWLIFFYQQDRLEPEPKGYVVGVFVLGALLAQAVGIPLVRDVFQTNLWFSASPLANLLGAILVVGFTQEFLKYAAVRYSVFPSAEFDERADGIIYGTAAGLGYATALNLHYIIASGGVNLGVGAIRVVATTLAQASFTGLVGYFLGRAKFEDEPAWWLPAGVTLAAVLSGLFTYLNRELTTTRLTLSGGGFTPWPSLILAISVASATFVALFFLIRRANRITLSGADARPVAPQGGAQSLHSSARRDRWADWIVIALAIVALAGGAALREAVLSRAAPFEFAGISGQYPAGWMRETGDDPILRVSNPEGGAFPPTLELRIRALADEATPALALNLLTTERAGRMTAYRSLGSEPTSVNGTTAIQRTFTYVEERRDPYTSQMPVVVKGVDLVLPDNGRVIIITFMASADNFDANYRYLRAFAESLEF